MGGSIPLGPIIQGGLVIEANIKFYRIKFKGDVVQWENIRFAPGRSGVQIPSSPEKRLDNIIY